jgi:chitodextrinase
LRRVQGPISGLMPRFAAKAAPPRRHLGALALLVLFVGTVSQAGGANARPPKPPANLTVAGMAVDSITLAWEAPRGNREAATYGVYKDSVLLAETPEWSYSFTGLTCETSYSLGVDALDPAGNRSSVEYVVASTAACPEPAPPPPPPPDATPPTTPTNLALASAAQTELAFTWSPSIDDTGVTDYAAYIDGVSAGATTTTSLTASSLTCGTSYTFGVEALDAARNRSPRASVSASTTPCSPPPAPPPPPPNGPAYYVSPAGSDVNPGTLDRPWKTLQKAMATLRAGDTAYLRAGTYEEVTERSCDSSYNTLTWSVSGTSSAPITISGYPSEEHQAIVSTKLKLTGSYLRLTGLVLDRNHARSSFDLACTGEPNLNLYGDDIEVNALEIRNSNMSGIYLNGADRTTITGNWIHDNGTHRGLDHGIYYGSGVGGMTANNVIERNFAYGVQMYPGPVGQTIVHNTISGSGKAGMILSGARDLVIANNISSWNAEQGIRTGGNGCVGCLAEENLLYGNSSDYYLPLPLEIISTVHADPFFVDRAARNYHLRSDSPAIDVGQAGRSAATDFDGRPRPRGAAPDIGAFEY